jgi:uncharacterized protein
MPMGIERARDTRARADRRRLLLAAALGLVVTPTAWAQSANDIVLAWDDPAGAHWVGVLRIEGGAATVAQRMAVPTRAHGLLSLADGAVIAIARRPGDWLLRWVPGGGPPQWLWANDERRFNGHALASPDGSALFCTEADADSGAGFLVRRDARTLAATDAWPTGGIDPHDIEALDGGRVVVANGGVATRPETGRAKVDLAAMDSSLVCMDTTANGRVLQSWRLPDRRLSLRHLARRADGTIGVAMQAEHDDPAERAAAPMLALLDAGLHTLQPMAIRGSGYAGDITATAQGWAVACPRESRVMLCSAEGRLIDAVALDETCALADAPTGLIALGRTAAWQAGQAGEQPPHTVPLPPGVQPDNHAVRYRS